MTVVVAANQVGYYTSPISLTAGDTDRLILAAVVTVAVGAVDTTMAYNSNSMTQILNDDDIVFSRNIRGWSYTPSVAASANVEGTSSNTLRGTMAVALTGFDGTTPVRGVSTYGEAGSSVTIAHSITTVADDLVIGFVYQGGTASFSAASGTTLVQKEESDGTIAILSKTATGTSTTVEVTTNDTGSDWLIALVAIAPAAEAYSPPTLPFVNILLVP